MTSGIRNQDDSSKVGEQSGYPQGFVLYKQKPILADLYKETIYRRATEVIHQDKKGHFRYLETTQLCY